MKTKVTVLALVAFVLAAAGPVAGQVPDQLKHSIQPPPGGPQSGGLFGASVSIRGGMASASAEYAGQFPLGEGPATAITGLYDTTSGALLRVLPDPYRMEESLPRARAGRWVPDGPFIQFEQEATGGNNASSMIHVYDAGVTTRVLTLHDPNPAPNWHFPGAVAVAGNRMAVSAYYYDEVTEELSGKVYLYDFASATPTVPYGVLNDPDSNRYSWFGFSLVWHGSRLLVGAGSNRPGEPFTGMVNIFDLSSGVPTTPVMVIHDPGTTGSNAFGGGLTISGSTLVVVAHGYSTGRVYTFDLAAATPTIPTMIFDNPRQDTYTAFGNAVALSGTKLLIGAPYDDVPPGIGTEGGRVFVYDLAGGTPTVPQMILDNPNPSGYGEFGCSIGIDGGIVIIGAWVEGGSPTPTGAAYLFNLNGATPGVPTATLASPSPSIGDQFGLALALSGTRLVAGAPFDTGNAYGFGAVSIFDLASATPTSPTLVLRPPVSDGGYRYGYAVATGGPYVAVGDPDFEHFDPSEEPVYRFGGRTYIYDFSTATPAAPALILDNPAMESIIDFGAALAIHGSRIAVGAPRPAFPAGNDGKVYLYDVNGASPGVPELVFSSPSGQSGSRYGIALAMSGSRLAVGASAAVFNGKWGGKVYVYDLASATPTVPAMVLENPTPDDYDYFGFALAIEGTKLVVGAYGDDADAANSGRAYVYDLASSTPSLPFLTLSNPSPGQNDGFGGLVGMSGSRIAITAYADSNDALYAGSAYVYDLNSPTPAVPVSRLASPRPRERDLFGDAVAIDGATIAVGAPFEDAIQRDKGGVYVFGPSPYSWWKVSELGDPFAPDLGDTDRDGVSNLGEYGLLRSPTMPGGAATTAGLASYAEGSRLRMSVLRDPARNDVTLEVQATATLLGPWTTIATSTLGAPFAGPGYYGGDSATPGVKAVEMRDVVNTTNAAQRFLRVRVRH